MFQPFQDHHLRSKRTNEPEKDTEINQINQDTSIRGLTSKYSVVTDVENRINYKYYIAQVKMFAPSACFCAQFIQF